MALLTLERADFPGIDPADVGSIARRGYGTVEDVRIHCIVGGATSVLTADITAAATSIAVKDASRFPAAPFTLQIGGELMTVTAKSGDTFTTVTRSATAPSPHPAGRTAYEVRTSYVYLVSDEPLHATSAVYVDGVKQTTGFTAYTGQGGGADHADWPGKAVIEFAAAGTVVRQRNTPDAGTESVLASATICTSSAAGVGTATAGANGPNYTNMEAGDAATSIPVNLGVGGTGQSVVKVLFAAPAGSILRTVVTAALTLDYVASDDRAALLLSASREDTGAVVGLRRIDLATVGAAGATGTYEIDCGTYHGNLIVGLSAGGAKPTQVTGTLTVTHTRIQTADAEATSTITLRPVTCSRPELVGEITAGGVALLAGDHVEATFAAFNTELGLYVSDSIDIEYTGSQATGYTSAVRRCSDATLVGAGTEATRGFFALQDNLTVTGITKTVTFIPRSATTAGGDTAHSTSARAVIGTRVTVDADWHYDPDNTYGGTGNLIERPDWAIKHFVRNYMGAAIGEVDATTFSAAGTLYAAAITGGYKFGFIIPKLDGWEVLKQMGFSARSTVRFLGGKYYLNYTPDTAPAASRTLTRADLAGAGSRYVYDRASVRSIFNDLTALYSRNYSGDTTREISSGYLATAAASDATSIAKFGTYSTQYELRCVRSATMAEHVLAHHLLEVKVPPLTVSFTAFWEHSDLAPGATIGITDDLFTGRAWWVESTRRRDKFTVDITGKEWW